MAKMSDDAKFKRASDICEKWTTEPFEVHGDGEMALDEIDARTLAATMFLGQYVTNMIVLGGHTQQQADTLISQMTSNIRTFANRSLKMAGRGELTMLAPRERTMDN